jgi:hypothetical protein
MAPHIRLVKIIVYAIDRRVRGVPRNAAEAASNTQHSPMTFQQACADLEDAARQLDAKGTASSMSQMARDVVPSLLEFSPAEYEVYCEKAGIPLYSSSPADFPAAPADLVVAQAAGMAATAAAGAVAAAAASPASAAVEARGLHGAGPSAATNAQGAGGGSSPPVTQLSLVSAWLA